jgi:hypothetical protein
MDGMGLVVTGSSKWSWMFSHTGHQGADEMEVLPACNWKIALEWRSFFTCMTEDQKMDLDPELVAVQKEELWKYLDLRTDVRRGFLLLAMLKAT